MTPNPQNPGAVAGEAAIREALAAGPTPGPWRAFNHSWSDTSILADGFDHGICLLDINYATEESQEADEALMAANAALIAACNPVAITALLAELDRLRASQSDGTSGGWRPIESAPKDGTHILVSWPMRQMDEEGMPTGPVTRRDTLVTWMNGGAWIEPDYLGASGEWFGDDDCYAVEPDLWQPLPPAPKSGDKSHE